MYIIFCLLGCCNQAVIFFLCMIFLCPVPLLQSAFFRQPSAHGSSGAGRKHFLPLLRHLAECSVHAHLRKGAQRLYSRYVSLSSLSGRGSSRVPSLTCLSLFMVLSPLMSDHVDAMLPLVWFDHGRFHLAFDGESGYSAVHLPSFHLAVLPHACWSPSQNGAAVPTP